MCLLSYLADVTAFSLLTFILVMLNSQEHFLTVVLALGLRKKLFRTASIVSLDTNCWPKHVFLRKQLFLFTYFTFSFTYLLYFLFTFPIREFLFHTKASMRFIFLVAQRFQCGRVLESSTFLNHLFTTG